MGQDFTGNLQIITTFQIVKTKHSIVSNKKTTENCNLIELNILNTMSWKIISDSIDGKGRWL